MREALIRDIRNNESSSNYIPYPCTYNTGNVLKRDIRNLVSYNDLFYKI